MTAYETAVLADTPKGYWKLGEGSGTTATDSSGNAHNGTYGSGVSWSNTGVNETDDCVQIHQTANDYMEVADHADFKPTVALAIEVWVARTAVANGNERIFDKMNTGNGHRIYLQSGSDTINCNLRINGGDQTLTYDLGKTGYGKFQHIVLTWAGTGTKVELWVDKVKVVESASNVTGTLDTVTTNIQWGRKGASDSTGDHLTGWLDEAAFYAAALNSTQIAAHFDAASFGTGGSFRVSEILLEAIIQDATPEIRVSEILAEAVVQDTSPEIRVSLILIEAVVESFWHGFGIIGDTNDDLVYTAYSGGAASDGRAVAKSRSTAEGTKYNPGTGPAYRKNVDYRNNSDYRG